MNTPKDIHIAGLTNDLMTVRDNLKSQLAEKDAKIAEQAAQIVALREQLGSFLAQYGCSCGHPACRDCWRTKDAKEALSTPAPPVVALEEVQALANALESLRDEQNGPPLERHKEHWQAAYDTANKVLAEFQSKRPQP